MLTIQPGRSAPASPRPLEGSIHNEIRVGCKRCLARMQDRSSPNDVGAALLHPTALAERIKRDARRRVPSADPVACAELLGGLLIAERNTQRRAVRPEAGGST